MACTMMSHFIPPNSVGHGLLLLLKCCCIWADGWRAVCSQVCMSLPALLLHTTICHISDGADTQEWWCFHLHEHDIISMLASLPAPVLLVARFSGSSDNASCATGKMRSQQSRQGCKHGGAVMPMTKESTNTLYVCWLQLNCDNMWCKQKCGAREQAGTSTHVSRQHQLSVC